MFDLKKVYNEFNNRNYWSDFKFEVIYSNSGVARIYINDSKTSYTAGGYGYDKESAVIASMINDITINNCKYNKKHYGNNGKKLSCSGVGFSSIQTSFNSKRGCKLEKIYSGFNSDVYEIKISDKLLIKGDN